VLHFHTQATAYCSLARMRRTPSIVSIDCTQGLAALEAPNLLERWTYGPNLLHDRLVFRRAAAITSISRWAARDLGRCYPECADKVHVMPYPVKLDLFPAGWAEERKARGREEPDRPVHVLFIGGDFPRKGGPELLSAWKQGEFAPRAHLH